MHLKLLAHIGGSGAGQGIYTGGRLLVSGRPMLGLHTPSSVRCRLASTSLMAFIPASDRLTVLALSLPGRMTLMAIPSKRGEAMWWP